MFHTKNLPGWERALRVLLGATLIALAMWLTPQMPLRWLAMIVGVGAMLTAFVGFCPACALAGRRLRP